MVKHHSNKQNCLLIKIDDHDPDLSTTLSTVATDALSIRLDRGENTTFNDTIKSKINKMESIFKIQNCKMKWIFLRYSGFITDKLGLSQIKWVFAKKWVFLR